METSPTQSHALAQKLKVYLEKKGHVPHQLFLSRREICDQFAVNTTVAQDALAELEREGAIYSLPRKGTFVSPSVRNHPILLIGGSRPTSQFDIPEQAMGGFLAGCLKGIELGNLPVALLPVSADDFTKRASSFEYSFRGAQGIIVFRNRDILDLALEITRQRDIPLGFYGSRINEEKLQNSFSIFTDDEVITDMALKHLAECGHKSILCLAESFAPHKARARYFAEWMKRRFPQTKDKIPGDPPVLFLDTHIFDRRPEFDLAFYREVADRIHREARGATAIYCTSDRVANLALHALIRTGTRVPEDMAIMGVNNDLETGAAIVPISTVNIPVLTEGERFIRGFFARVLKPPTDPKRAPSPHAFTKCELVARESTGAKIKSPTTLSPTKIARN